MCLIMELLFHYIFISYSHKKSIQREPRKFKRDKLPWLVGGLREDWTPLMRSTQCWLAHEAEGEGGLKTAPVTAQFPVAALGCALA